MKQGQPNHMHPGQVSHFGAGKPPVMYVKQNNKPKPPIGHKGIAMMKPKMQRSNSHRGSNPTQGIENNIKLNLLGPATTELKPE